MVTLHEHPTNEAKWEQIFREVSRLKALHDLSLLDEQTETIYDRFTKLATEVLKTSVSLISMVAEDHQFFKSQFGLTGQVAKERNTPLSHSFCKHVVATNEPLIVENAPEHPIVHDNLAIRDMNVMSYLGMPLTLNDGTRLGSFCVLDTQPKKWKKIDLAIMKELSEIITTEFDARALTYLDQSRQPELDSIRERTESLLHKLDTSLPKRQFLTQLRTARREYKV